MASQGMANGSKSRQDSQFLTLPMSETTPDSIKTTRKRARSPPREVSTCENEKPQAPRKVVKSPIARVRSQYRYRGNPTTTTEIGRALSGFWSPRDLESVNHSLSTAASPVVPSPSTSVLLQSKLVPTGWLAGSTSPSILPRSGSATTPSMPRSRSRATLPGLRVSIPSFSSSSHSRSNSENYAKPDEEEVAGSDARTEAKRPKLQPAPPQTPHPTLQYKVLALLKDTLQGKIVHARHVVSEREVVLKVCKTFLVRSRQSFYGEAMLEDVENEILILKQLGDHPNIISLIEVLRSDNHVWIVLERAPKGDFLDVIHRAKVPFTETQVLRYTRQLLEAVRFCHSHSVCHLDISIENVLLGSGDALKLCDFGLAHRIDGGTGIATDPPLPDSAKPGKLAFMAPEVYLGVRPFDARKADMYSVGVTIFVLLFSRLPYKQPHDDDRHFRLAYDTDATSFRQLLKQQGIAQEVSDTALEFLSSLFAPVDRRLSAEEALKHAWLQSPQA